MTAKELFDEVKEAAIKYFGMIPSENETKGNAIIRCFLDNKKNGNDDSNSAYYFGFISNEEDKSGPYSDFSFVVFPDKIDGDIETCAVTLGVGTQGFKNDYQLAARPGTRRMFLKLKEKNEESFFKTAFDDIENPLNELVTKIEESNIALKNDYKKVLQAGKIVKSNGAEEGEKISLKYEDEQKKTKSDEIKNKTLITIYKWLAVYAELRKWNINKKGNGNNRINDNIKKTLAYNAPTNENEDETIIRELLDKRKYVVLQGAPGTGKTYTALNIAKEYNKVFFEQFHAETNYSDFVYGIEPVLDTNNSTDTFEPKFKPKEGILYQAINHAKENKSEKVILVIDEINRANLSNVLGPVFYLFEYQSNKRRTDISIGDMKITSLPDNLYVIATMNTADRSLAVVDFALRRRFAWYTLRPHIIKKVDEGKVFMKETFEKFADIFFEFATDDELNLQPGHSYFIVKNGNEEEQRKEMKERLIYELMPLIKEYLAEGYLLKAKDSFCNLFLEETGLLMYE